MSFQASLIEELWRVRCGDGSAHASIWTHPQGWELRILWDGLPAARLRHADLATLHRSALDAHVQLLREGRQGLDDLCAAWRRSKR